MKVLVTGANGLLGVNLVRELRKANMAVKAFVRPSANLKGLQEVPCQLIRGDLFSDVDVSKALDDCDAIVHAASTTSVAPLRFEYYRNINVEATKNIVQAVLNQGKRLVYVSTANAFGPGSKENPGRETSPFSLRHYHSGYINSKYMAQQHVLQTVEKQNLDAVVVNPTFIIGAYDTKPSSGKIILQGLKRGIQWCPPGGKNFVHARDVAQGIHRSLMLGKKGECYLLTGENLTYKEFFSQLNKVTNRSRVQITVPKMAVHAAGAIAEAWNRLNDQKLVFNKTNAHLLSLENYYAGDKAKREFHLESTPIQHAIEEALAWFKQENFVSEDNYSTQGTNFAL
jgi:dihydroflavonol-4-reductase